MEHKRGGAPGGAGWAVLSHPIMNIIIAKTYRSERFGLQGLQGILDLRLVCKGWRDACSDYAGPVYIGCKGHTDLLRICKILPGLSDLDMDILMSEADTCFSVLSKMTSLRALAIIQNSSKKTPLHDLRHVPSTLKQLSLRQMIIDPLCEISGLTGLTSLSCSWPKTLGDGAFSLLQRLPALQELDFDGPELDGEPEEDLGAVFRCGSFTKIELSFGLLLAPVHMPVSASTLRDLDLYNMDISVQWLHTMSPLLTNLTHLHILECNTEPEDAHNLQAISSLRSLQLDTSGHQLLALASPDLQRLHFGASALDAQHFATLRALTYLELDLVNAWIPAGARPSPSPQLLELSLRHSDNMIETLLLPGTLPVLQKLHLDEDLVYSTDADGNVVDQEGVVSEATGPKAYELQRAIFSCPNLSELSGWCRLFLLGIPDNWYRWSGAEVDGLVVTSGNHRTFLDYPGQIWRKFA